MKLTATLQSKIHNREQEWMRAMCAKSRVKLLLLGMILWITRSPVTHPAAREPAASVPAQRLAARAIAATPMLDDLRELCDRIGGRPTGSPGV